MAVATLLPETSGAIEVAQATANAIRLDLVRNEVAILGTLQDPWRCPASEIKLLAWDRSVDYWSDAWREPRQRQVVAESRLYHRRKTTVAGVRMALAYRDAELVGVNLPRHGFFVDTAVNAGDRAAWLAALAEIRIFDPAPFVLPGPARRFAGVNCFARGDARLGRRAVLVRDGVETDLAYLPVDTPDGVSERLVLPVSKRRGLIVGRAGSRTAFGADLGVTVLAIRTGQSSFARPAATPGDAGAFVEAQRKLIDGARVAMTPVRRGGLRIVAPAAVARGYLSLKYSDKPGRLAPRAPSNVVGRSRVTRAPFTGNWLVGWSRRVTGSALPSGRLVAPRSEPLVETLMGAIVDAQAARDNHTITLSATRRLTYADIRSIKPGTTFGQRRKAA